MYATLLRAVGFGTFLICDLADLHCIAMSFSELHQDKVLLQWRMSGRAMWAVADMSTYSAAVHSSSVSVKSHLF